jgi:hypothetical protein
MPNLFLLPRGARNLAGLPFGDLTAERIVKVVPRKGALWRARCRCGRTREVFAYALTAGQVRRCRECRRARRTEYLIAAHRRARSNETVVQIRATRFERRWELHLGQMTEGMRALFDDLVARRARQGIVITPRLKSQIVDVVMRERVA